MELVGQLSECFGVRVHGWVWMSNHSHLLVETPAANLSRAMQGVQVSSSVWFNQRHRRVGHLFQGRFQAIVMEADQWRWPLSQSLHLNPVRIKELGGDKQLPQRAGQGLGGPPSAALVARRLAALAACRAPEQQGLRALR